MPAPQSFENHRRIEPLFHYVAAPLTLVAIIVAIALTIMGLVKAPGIQSGLMGVWMIALSVAGAATVLMVRMYSLRVQDRVIALEVERRFERLGGVGTIPLSERLKPGQLVALRFASDGELVALAERAAQEQLASKDIKRAIRNWRPDHRRV